MEFADEHNKCQRTADGGLTCRVLLQLVCRPQQRPTWSISLVTLRQIKRIYLQLPRSPILLKPSTRVLNGNIKNGRQRVKKLMIEMKRKNVLCSPLHGQYRVLVYNVIDSQIDYASHPFFASPRLHGGRKYAVVLQFRIKPGTYRVPISRLYFFIPYPPTLPFCCLTQMSKRILKLKMCGLIP